MSTPEGAVPHAVAPPTERPAPPVDRPADRAADRPAPPRRGPADPVRTLMHRHQELCARAVDALEIAAGLEAHGVTDRTAARFRHRDVFSLAEELYARVPRADRDTAAADGRPPAPARRSRGVRAALQLLPGAVCAATVAAVAAADTAPPAVRAAVGAAGTVLVALAVRLALRSGPLRRRHGGGPRTTVLWVCWTAGYAVWGDWLLSQLLTGGPDLPHAAPRAAVATAVALTCALAPAAGCAHWYARHARRRLATSRGLEELAARVRPLLPAATLLFLAALVALLLGADAAFGAVFGAAGPAAPVAAGALGVLLFLARLLTVHGFPEAASAGLASAAAAEYLALTLVLIARLPGVPPLDAPVAALTTAAGTAAVPALACTAAALGLLGYGLRALTGACAHSPAPAGPAEGHRP
ncbi:hypothetical protein [Streptomyces kronopolitis]